MLTFLDRLVKSITADIFICMQVHNTGVSIEIYMLVIYLERSMFLHLAVAVAGRQVCLEETETTR